MMKSYTYSGNVPGAQVLAEILADLETAEARTQTLAGDLSELRENVLLGLGMTVEAVASMDADMMEPCITDLLAGHGELAAEVERLRAELAAMTEAWENQCAARVNDGAALYVQQFALEDEVAALRAQLDAAGEGWRPVTENWPPPSQSLPVLMRNGVIRWGYRARGLWHLTNGNTANAVTHAYVLRPAPPQE